VRERERWSFKYIRQFSEWRDRLHATFSKYREREREMVI
jgi:hypothetical protein